MLMELKGTTMGDSIFYPLPKMQSSIPRVQLRTFQYQFNCGCLPCSPNSKVAMTMQSSNSKDKCWIN